jgi:predicted dinucleotide-utilizing enzyme
MAFPPMSTEIGFGIVGAGRVARNHARAIAETPGARLAAICRADAARADEAAAELGVPCEASLEALLERPDVDAVCFCSSSGLHAEQAVAAARAAKDVLVEKPMALCLADAPKVEVTVGGGDRGGARAAVVGLDPLAPPAHLAGRHLDADGIAAVVPPPSGSTSRSRRGVPGARPRRARAGIRS